MIKLKNVRLGAFPALFRKAVFQGEEQDKYNCAFLLDPTEHSDIISAIEEGISEIRKEKWKGAKLPSDKYCMRDGDDTGKDYNEGYMVVKASCKARPLVIDRSKNVLTEEDGVIYAGCRVNANIRLWAQDNQFGKRVNAELEGVQFVGNDESLETGGARSAESQLKDFDSFDEDEDDLLAVN